MMDKLFGFSLFAIAGVFWNMGNNVVLADIDRKFVQEWVGAMRKGGLNATTIAIWVMGRT